MQLEHSLKQIDKTSKVLELPAKYRKTQQESYISRSTYAERVAENAFIRHMSEVRAARTATQC